jgi:hypothetical protein
MAFGGMLMQHMRVSQDEAAARLSGIDKEKADQEYELGIQTIQYTLDAVLIASVVPTCIALLYRQWTKRKENATAVGNLARGLRRSAVKRFSSRSSTRECKGDDNDGDIELPDMVEEPGQTATGELNNVEVKVDGNKGLRTTTARRMGLARGRGQRRELNDDGDVDMRGREAEDLDLPATSPRRSAGGRAWENPNPMYGLGTETKSKEGHNTAPLENRSSSILSKTVTCGVPVGLSGAAWICGRCKAVNAKSAPVCLKCKAVRTQEAPTATAIEAARGGVGRWGASPAIDHGDGGTIAKPAPDHENAPARPRSRSRRLRDILKHASASKSASGGGAKYEQQGLAAEETPAPPPVSPPPAVPVPTMPQTSVPTPTLPPPPPMVSPPPLPEEMQLSGMGRTQSMEL